MGADQVEVAAPEQAPASPERTAGVFGEPSAEGEAAQLLQLQRTAGNRAVGRMLARQGAGTPTVQRPAAAAQASAPPGPGDGFDAAVPKTNNPDDMLRSASTFAHSSIFKQGKIDHVVAIVRAVHVATVDGKPTANYAFKGTFSLPPGIYVIATDGTTQFGWRNGKATHRPIGLPEKSLPPELRRDKLKRKLIWSDWVNVDPAQEEKEFGTCVVFVAAPTPSDADLDPSKDHTGEGSLEEGGGFGSEIGQAGGKAAALPRWPARMQVSQAMRTLTIEGTEVKYVLQPVGGSATYQMWLDFSSFDPNVFFQAAAASVATVYRWELWDITNDADKSIAAEAAKHGKVGGGRTIGKREAAGQDWDRTTKELKARPKEINEQQRKAWAERRYLDVVAGEVNRELEDVGELAARGENVLGWLSDATGPDRERRIPTVKEGWFVVRCVAFYDPSARRQQRPDRAPSVASMIVRVMPVERLSVEAVGSEEEQAAAADLFAGKQRALVTQLGADATQADRDLLAKYDQQAADARLTATGMPVALLTRLRAVKKDDLDKATAASALLKAGIPDRDVSRLKDELADLDKQIAHAQAQARDLSADPSKRGLYRLRATLVSRVTGATYPLRLVINEPQWDGTVYRCGLADASSKSGKAYEGVSTAAGPGAMAAVWSAVDRLASDDLGYGDGSITVRLPDEGLFKGMSETDRTKTFESKPRDWAAAKARLEEVATLLALVAMLGVPGVGEAGAVIGAALAAERIASRVQNHSFEWDMETVSDCLAIAAAVSMGAQALGKLKIVRGDGKWALVMAKDEGRLTKLAKATSKWVIDPAALIWGDISLTKSLIAIDADPTRPETDRRREKFKLMASAINTNLPLLSHMAPHDDGAFEKGGKKPPAGGSTDNPPARGTPSREPPPRDPRQPTDHPPPTDPPPTRNVTGPDTRPADQPAAGGGGHDLPPPGGSGGTGGPPPPPAPKPTLSEVTATRSPTPQEATALVTDAKDWKGALRAQVDALPTAEQKTRAEAALAEARKNLVYGEINAVADQFGIAFRDFGTPGFRSDIDATIVPKEKTKGYTGPERPVADQIRAASAAAEKVADALRQKGGGEPDRVLDTNIYSYIGEDAVKLPDDPAARNRASAQELDIGFAEARRGMSDEQWRSYREQIGEKLKGLSAKDADAMRASLNRGEAFNAEMARQRAAAEEQIRRGSNTPPDQVAREARDAILAMKKKQLADLFAAPHPDMVAILRLQAEIRWFAPDAYAGGAAFEYAVGFGQARRAAGTEEAGPGKEPTREQVLADLKRSLAAEAARTPKQKISLLAGAASSQLGMMNAHAQGAGDHLKPTAKYAARILDLLNAGGLYDPTGRATPNVDQRIPRALSEFVVSRYAWGEGSPMPKALELQMLARFAEASGLGDQVVRKDGAIVSVSDAVRSKFVEETQKWATDQAARLQAIQASMESEPVPKPVPTGGVRGPTYATDNTYQRNVEVTTPEGKKETQKQTFGSLTSLKDGKLVIGGTGAKAIDRAMKAIGGDGLPGGARLEPAAGRDYVASGDSVAAVLSVPDARTPGAEVKAAVTIRVVETAALPPSGHTGPGGVDEGGPVRVVPKATTVGGVTTWQVEVYVDSRMRGDDLRHAIGHEMAEAGELIRRHPDGADPATLSTEMSAGLFTQDWSSPATTAHDIAAARELGTLCDEYDNLIDTKASAARVDERLATIDRLKESMGLNTPEHADEKLAALRAAGITREAGGQRAQLISEYEQLVSKSVANERLRGVRLVGQTGTIFDESLVRHTMYGDVVGGEVKGGHRTAALRELAQRHPRLAIREVANRAAGGTTWRKYEVYMWKDATRAKPISEAALGSTYVFDPAEWTRAFDPKTTADDYNAYMREVEGAWRTWLAQHDGTSPGAVDAAALSATTFNAPGPAGVQIEAFYDPTGGAFKFKTAYADAAWF